MSLRLNLGCSTTELEGFVGVDVWTPPWATEQNFLRADLKRSWPWQDGTVDFILAADIVEHLPDKIHTMNEIFRVLKPGGMVEIIVPTTDGPGAWQDPTHCSYWNKNSFMYHKAGDPHYERFHEAYGIKGAFIFDAADLVQTVDDWGVVKLKVFLSKAEEEQKGYESAMKGEKSELFTDVTKGTQPIFSIIHASARPGEWKKVYDAWIAAATMPELFEYILVLDAKYFTLADMEPVLDMVRPQDAKKVIWNSDQPNYVNNVNRGAKSATGMILIVNADDQYPCAGWDRELGSLPLKGLSPSCPPNDYVIEVSTGTPNEHERGLMVMPILYHHRYTRIGYVFYPEYESMYADNDFCAVARRDKCVIDGRHLMFPHKHPMVLTGKFEVAPDDPYIMQNRSEAYTLGAKIFEARVKTNFADDIKVETQAPATAISLVKSSSSSSSSPLYSVRPIFSLCHATARTPDAWRKTLETWRDNCTDPSMVEHIIVADEPLDLASGIFANTKIGVLNGPKKDCVAAWNYAAKLSSGDFIILVADDFYPCKNWDEEILKAVGGDFRAPKVLEVSTGGHTDVITHPMMTREYYARYGYALYPEFVSVFADNDFTDQARKDGVVVDGKHLRFHHDHPTITGKASDAVYLSQGSDEAYETGKRIYTFRIEQRGAVAKKKIAVCVPGESFSAAWMDAWTNILGFLIGRYDLSVHFGYSSNVYVTRGGIADGVLNTRPTADYVLWIDDDNLLTIQQLQMLIEDLDTNPDLDIAAAWTWIATDVYSHTNTNAKISAGIFHPNHGGCISLDRQALDAAPSDLIDVDWTGFPAVLMRFSTLVKAGLKPFLPILSDLHEFGLSGEDTAFCKRAKDRGGCRIAVDRRVKVPHLKLRSAEPIELPSVAVAEVAHK